MQQEVDAGSKGSKGYYLVGWGRQILYVSQITFQVALVALAYQQAGCKEYTDDLLDAGYDDSEVIAQFYNTDLIDIARIRGANYTLSELEGLSCKQTKAYGFKPSSVITTMGIVGGLVAALAMPLAGAITDSTNSRQRFGVAMAALLTFTNLVQTALTEDTWFAMAILQATVCAFAYMGLAMVVYAYVPELTQSSAELSRIMGNARICEVAGMLFLLLIVGVSTVVLKLGVVHIAIVAQLSSVLLGGPAVLYATACLYPPRRTSNPPPAGTWLVTHGFHKMYKAMKMLPVEYPAVGRYLFANVLYEGATMSVTAIVAVWLVEGAHFPLESTSLFIAASLFCMLPGVLIHKTVVPRIGFKKSLLMALASLSFIETGFVFIGSSPVKAWPFAFFLGLAMGWYYPTSGGTLMQFVPPGKEAELAGLSMFCSIAISWLPALVVTWANENECLVYGMLILPALWMAGFVIILGIDEQHGIADAEPNTTDVYLLERLPLRHADKSVSCPINNVGDGLSVSREGERRFVSGPI